MISRLCWRSEDGNGIVNETKDCMNAHPVAYDCNKVARGGITLTDKGQKVLKGTCECFSTLLLADVTLGQLCTLRMRARCV